MLQASTAVQYFCPTWLMLPYSRQGKSKHLSSAIHPPFRNAQQARTRAVVSYPLTLLKNVITTLFLSILITQLWQNGYTEEEEAHFLHSEIFWNTAGPFAWSKMDEVSHRWLADTKRLLAGIFKIYFVLCLSHKVCVTQTVKELNSSKTHCSPMQARPCMYAFSKHLPNPDTRLPPHM